MPFMIIDDVIHAMLLRELCQATVNSPAVLAKQSPHLTGSQQM